MKNCKEKYIKKEQSSKNSEFCNRMKKKQFGNKKQSDPISQHEVYGTRENKGPLFEWTEKEAVCLFKK